MALLIFPLVDMFVVAAVTMEPSFSNGRSNVALCGGLDNGHSWPDEIAGIGACLVYVVGHGMVVLLLHLVRCPPALIYRGSNPRILAHG